MSKCSIGAVDCQPEGTPMRIVSGLSRGMLRLARRPAPELSKEAKLRLAWFDWHRRHGENVSLTCRHFGISRPTFYRWLKRYRPLDLRTLESRSSRPKRCRQRSWTLGQLRAVQRLRERYPRWGKDKLVILLRREGVELSTSMVGRILSHLKRTGQLIEPLLSRIRTAKRRLRRVYAVRKPKGYPVDEPGDLVQVDTLDVRLLPGMTLKQFTARDMVSRWDTLDLRSRATARTAADFLQRLLERMPFAVKAIQVDGGSEYMADFEQACKLHNLLLFALPPRSPKLNGQVERAQQTHTEGFYEVTLAEPKLNELRAELREWEKVYNTIRPHQALNYLTPLEFVTQWNQQCPRKEVV